MTLLEFQRELAGGIMAPLSGRNDGDSIHQAGTLIRRNGLLAPRERLEIYRRSYWFRVLDSLAEDFPGLCAILGPRAFRRLAQAYLFDSPSQSFTMRDLGSELEAWLRHHSYFASGSLALALDMVRLEWAHIKAFDGAASKPLGPEDLLELGPEMRFALQPSMTLLDLNYPVDDLRLRIQAAANDEAGGRSLRRKERSLAGKYGAMNPEPMFLAVHRMDFAVYYRRLAPDEYRILDALSRGIPIGEAIDSLQEVHAIESWFASWSRLGWLCRRAA